MNIVSKLSQTWIFVPDFVSEIIFTATEKVNIFARETFAVLTETVPNYIRWQIRIYYLHTIKEEKISDLFFHSLGSSEKPTLLFLPGVNSHPSTLLRLIDHCSQNTVYSLNPSYNEENPEQYRKLIRKTIEFLKNQYATSIILVGHSKGAIESAHLAFVELNPNIRSVISIAGRLAVPEDSSCHPDLKPTIAKIQTAINAYPHIPLYQIIAEKDWNAPLEATCIRPQTATIIKNALHLNILYYPETSIALQKFFSSSDRQV